MVSSPVLVTQSTLAPDEQYRSGSPQLITLGFRALADTLQYSLAFLPLCPSVRKRGQTLQGIEYMIMTCNLNSVSCRVGLQLPGVLDDLYTYAGPLGAEITEERVSIRVWAPTAQQVSNNAGPGYRDILPSGRVSTG